MTILRVRAEAADEIGSLGKLAGAVAACRGNIVGLDVHGMGDDRVAPEFLVDVGGAAPDRVLALALRRAGGGRVDLERCGDATLDPVAHALTVAVRLFSPGSHATPGSRWSDRRLETAVRALVRADRARFIADEGRAAWPILVEAARAGHPMIRRWSMASPGGSNAPVWVLVMADSGAARRRWLVVERRAPRFSSSEVARIAGLLRLAQAGATAARAAVHAGHAGLGPPRPVRRRPASFFRHGRDAAGTATPATGPLQRVDRSTA